MSVKMYQNLTMICDKTLAKAGAEEIAGNKTVGQIYSVIQSMKFSPPVWFPDRDLSGLTLCALLSLSQDDVEAFNVIGEKTKTSCEHPVASSLDMTTKMDVPLWTPEICRQYSFYQLAGWHFI